MPRIFLATYRIQVRGRRRDEYQLMGAAERGMSFHEIFGLLLDKFSTPQRTDDLKALQRASQTHASSTDHWGVLDAGEFGFASELMNVDTLKASFRRGTRDAELLPFYYRLHAPANASSALLVLQRFGNRGIFQPLKFELEAHFRALFPDLTLDVTRVVPAAVVAAVLEGRLLAIEFESHSVPSDIADRFAWLGNVHGSSMKIQFKARDSGVLGEASWLRRVRQGVIQALSIPDEWEGERSTVSITVQYGDRSKKIRLGNPDSVIPYVDVTDAVTFGDDGHPTFLSIDRRARSLLEETRAQLGLES